MIIKHPLKKKDNCKTDKSLILYGYLIYNNKCFRECNLSRSSENELIIIAQRISQNILSPKELSGCSPKELSDDS